jgi:hypothetical protein
LQVQPESDVETEALLVLLHALRYERPPESDGPRTSDASSTPLGDAGESQGDLDVRL